MNIVESWMHIFTLVEKHVDSVQNSLIFKDFFHFPVRM